MFRPKTFQLEFAAGNHRDRISLLENLLTDRTIVYIDYGNVREWRKRLGWEIDLQKLKDLLDSFGVKEVRFYFGTTKEDPSASRFMTFVHKRGYVIRTKPVKKMNLSIDMTSITHRRSLDILSSFVNKTLLNYMRPEAIEYLNEELRNMNSRGFMSLECWKCNFDVEIGTDMRLAHHLNEADNFCLFSGDSDFADPLTAMLSAKRQVGIFGTARHIASELNALKSNGLKIFDIATLKDFLEKSS